MRHVPALSLLILGLALPACTRANGLAIDDDAGGGCGADCVDLASSDGDSTDLRRHKDMDSPPADLSKPGDLGPMMCLAACDHCFGGVCCAGGANGCCAAGEWCDASGQCRCGQNAACQNGLTCATGGPIGMQGQCGIICCGGLSNPCPL